MATGSDPAVRRRIRLSGAALVLSGLCSFTAPFLVVGTITPPAEGQVITETSAVNAISLEWRVGMAISFVGIAALTLGLFALYAHLARTSMERWALAGLVVTVVTIILYLSMLGIVTYVLPAVGRLIESGQTDAIAVLDRTWTDPFIVIPFLSGFLWHVGVVLMGIAVWRSGSPSKWGGLVLVVAGVLGIPAFFDVIVVQYLSTSVLAIGLIIVGLSLWNVGGSVEREL